MSYQAFRPKVGAIAVAAIAVLALVPSSAFVDFEIRLPDALPALVPT